MKFVLQLATFSALSIALTGFIYPNAFAAGEVYRCTGDPENSQTTYTMEVSEQDIHNGVCKKLNESLVSTIPSNLDTNKRYSNAYTEQQTSKQKQDLSQKRIHANKTRLEQVKALTQEKSDLQAQLKSLEDRRFRAENGNSRYRHLAPTLQERLAEINKALEDLRSPYPKRP